MEKTVIITGVSGQDGSYMAEYCLNLGHRVIGMVRRTSQMNDKNYGHLLNNPLFKVERGDLTDSSSLDNIVSKYRPDYFINLAAQSFVADSWTIPEETFMVGAVGVLKCLEAIRKYAPLCRFYNAGSSEEFGDVLFSPQDETHPMRPRSPYGAAKCAARHLVKVYRESYGLYAVQGYLFNHESERRGSQFVTRKITQGVARIKKALLNNEPFKPIELGNVYTKRDWSHAEDFMDGVWRMLNQDRYNIELNDELKYVIGDKKTVWIYLIKNLKEYVLASGETHTIEEFVTLAFKHAGIDALWVNGTTVEDCFKGISFDPLKSNCGIRQPNGVYPFLVNISKEFYRPNEVELLLGNPNKAKSELGWKPKISFDSLVKRMVSWDLYEAGLQPQRNNTKQEKSSQETQQSTKIKQ